MHSFFERQLHEFLRKIQLLQLLSTLFFINQAQFAWSATSAQYQPVLAEPSKKIAYFEYNFPGTGITIQTTKNVITFYGATENEINQIVACLRFNYSCPLLWLHPRGQDAQGFTGL